MLRQSKSTSNLKENSNVTKQGAFYELNLGKNNGPFLSKDIMYNNRMSMGLLTNLQILKSHETMMKTMSNMQQSNKDKLSKIGSQKVQNFNGLVQYCEQELKHMSELSNSLRVQERELKKQLHELAIKGQESISQLYESSMPGIKQFMRKVREMNTMDKEANYKVKRELQKMELEVSLLKKGVVECGNKIQNIKIETNKKRSISGDLSQEDIKEFYKQKKRIQIILERSSHFMREG